MNPPPDLPALAPPSPPSLLFSRRAALAALAAAGVSGAPGVQARTRASGGVVQGQGGGALVDAPASAPGVRALAGLCPRIDEQMGDVQSVVVAQRGQVLLEYYRQAEGVNADTLQDVQSVTKSVLSLLFGIALGEGRIRRVDGLVAERLPEMPRLTADAHAQRLRFAHLLTMTAGWPGDETARRDRDDDLRYIVRRPFVSAPGVRFAYDNGAANLLALALARAVGQRLSDYARPRLFAPLGITRFAWARGGNGHDFGALGLRLTARDMLRVGELVRQQGRWQGRALVPADYLNAATQRQNAGGPPTGTGYGYLWWVGTPSRKGAGATLMASGYGGQWIWIDPALDMVAVATSRRNPQSMARNQAATLIRAHIAPALRRV